MQRMGRAIVEAILPILENRSKDKDLSRPLRNSDLLLWHCMASYTQGDEQAQMTAGCGRFCDGAMPTIDQLFRRKYLLRGNNIIVPCGEQK